MLGRSRSATGLLARVLQSRAIHIARNRKPMGKMAENYSHAEVEANWQEIWRQRATERQQSNALERPKPDHYVLTMFPYPSGSLHMGHVRVYTIGDVVARMKRMRGHDIVHPIGWDAFGLPAENAAIERGVPAKEWTNQNIAQMKTQFERLGISFDWHREFATCHPDYYKWTQWIFLELFKTGQAYRAGGMVNWDPVDETVLANEQVDAEGRSWRSGAVVERVLREQWYFRITDYADELLGHLEGLDWPETIKTLQRQWIGKSEGASIRFTIVSADRQDQQQEVEVFTTRPDTLFGVSYLAMAKDHDVIQQLAPTFEAPDDFGGSSSSTVNNFHKDPSAGYCVTPLRAIHPLTGAEIPVYVADYVIADYGTGALMGVPAHDQRDFAFASHHGLPITSVVNAEGTREYSAHMELKAAYTGHGTLTNCPPGFAHLNGEPSFEGGHAIVAELENKEKGEGKTQYRLRDWLVSRQRYWGAPIPVVYCESNCGIQPVPVEDLPVMLPQLSKEELKNPKGSPLSRAEAWRREANCPKCGGPALRETDSMDTFVDSSWYFLRYLDPRNADTFVGTDVMPDIPRDGHRALVDVYVGGKEHAVLHLLYARFITKALRDMGHVPYDEPFQRLIAQGMVLGKTFRIESSQKPVPSGEVEYVAPSTGGDGKGFYRHISTGAICTATHEKMSKSKLNGVDPNDVISRYGADTARLFTLFSAPPADELSWDDQAVVGVHRWLHRFWKLCYEYCSVHSHAQEGIDSAAWASSNGGRHLLKLRNHLIDDVEQSLVHTEAFNNAVPALMKFTNGLKEPAILDGDKQSLDYGIALTTAAQLLSILAPHVGCELHGQLVDSHTGLSTELMRLGMIPKKTCSEAIDYAPWPRQYADLHSLREGSQVAFRSSADHDHDEEQITLVVQINGKTRATTQIPVRQKGVEDALRDLALALPDVQRHIPNRQDIIKTIVPKQGTLINLVIAKPNKNKRA
eukprot:Clim_evm50s214 gene=Clim_evmTU50s214